jgi:hypothetical protein
MSFALKRGITKEEVDGLLAGEIGNLSADEIPAVLYAQHWADTKGQVQQEAREEALAQYGEKKLQHIEALIRLSQFTSLCNNTVTVYQNIKGRRSIRFFFTYLLCKPLNSTMKRRYVLNKKEEQQNELKEA